MQNTQQNTLAKSLYRNKLTSPVGESFYAFLQKPNYKFNADGVYHVNLVCNSKKAGVQQTIIELNNLFDEHLAVNKEFIKNKNVVSRGYLVDEKDNVNFNFKLKAIIYNKKTQETYTRKPLICDSKGNTVVDIPLIGNGSLLKIGYTAKTYYSGAIGSGVTLILDAVQILKLEEYTGLNSIKDFDFATDELLEEDDSGFLIDAFKAEQAQ